jgi:predicted phosphohydrolase
MVNLAGDRENLDAKDEAMLAREHERLERVRQRRK